MPKHFVHGEFCLLLDKSYLSNLAVGAVANGYGRDVGAPRHAYGENAGAVLWAYRVGTGGVLR